MLVKLTTAPPPAATMCGCTACSMATALATFTLNEVSQSARGDLKPSSTYEHARFTRKCTPPWRAAASSTQAFTCASSVMSVRTKRTPAPSASASGWPLSASMSAMTTFTPAAWKARTTPAPINVEPPVTMALLPSSPLNMTLALLG
ncbi:hypothetical protein FQZ97_654100 [compost metagenome]